MNGKCVFCHRPAPVRQSPRTDISQRTFRVTLQDAELFRMHLGCARRYVTALDRPATFKPSLSTAFDHVQTCTK